MPAPALPVAEGSVVTLLGLVVTLSCTVADILTGFRH